MVPTKVLEQSWKLVHEPKSQFTLPTFSTFFVDFPRGNTATAVSYWYQKNGKHHLFSMGMRHAIAKTILANSCLRRCPRKLVKRKWVITPIYPICKSVTSHLLTIYILNSWDIQVYRNKKNPSAQNNSCGFLLWVRIGLATNIHHIFHHLK